MAEDWASVAAEVSAAIVEVGFAATLESPGVETVVNGDVTASTPETFPVTVIDFDTVTRDAGGMVTGSQRTLTVGASVVPEKGWRVQVRGRWHRIAWVKPLAPGGVDLLFELGLEG